MIAFALCLLSLGWDIHGALRLEKNLEIQFERAS